MTQPDSTGTVVDRHRTAIARSQLSRPLQLAARHGLLDGSKSVFDYGCGRGTDIAILGVSGITAAGWDPHYRPNDKLQDADVVNLGYVLNVIEDSSERTTALSKAYGLARECLIVSVVTPGSLDVSKAEQFADGVRTTRNTFQKLFEVEEARILIERTLEEEAIPIAPGIFFVFRDKVVEQRFLAGRHRRRVDISHLLTVGPPAKTASTWQQWITFDTHREQLTQLWQRIVELGRIPTPDELDGNAGSELVEQFASIRKAVEVAQVGFERREFIEARDRRIEDLRLYFALDLFNRRKPYTQLPPELKLDVHAFFGSYSKARDDGKELLFSVADTDVILEAAQEAADAGLGHLDEEHSLQLHASLLERLPSTLRAYVGCGEKMYGDVDQADLIKIHIASGKLTLIFCNNFDRSPLPTLKERVKMVLSELRSPMRLPSYEAT